jgi:hypothetical protein
VYIYIQLPLPVIFEKYGALLSRIIVQGRVYIHAHIVLSYKAIKYINILSTLDCCCKGVFRPSKLFERF